MQHKQMNWLSVLIITLLGYVSLALVCTLFVGMVN